MGFRPKEYELEIINVIGLTVMIINNRRLFSGAESIRELIHQQ